MSAYLRRKFGLFIRNIAVGVHLEAFFVSAITTFLAVRAWLDIVDYPTIGGERLHIAHMLWGGLLMMIAIFILVGYLNKEARHSAAIIGGVGWGLFVDELGKFITRDNNYFYQPTVAIIYVVFIGIFLVIQAMQRPSRYSKREYAVNALEAIKDIITHDLDEHEKRQALEFLSKSDPNNPVVADLRNLLIRFPAPSATFPGFFTELRRVLRDLYLGLIRNRWFANILIWTFAILSIFNLAKAVDHLGRGLTFAEWGQFLSAIASGVLVVVGIYFLRRKNRLIAYGSFKQAILVSIFLTQLFRFMREELSAVYALAISITMLIACQYLIDQEKATRAEEQLSA